MAPSFRNAIPPVNALSTRNNTSSKGTAYQHFRLEKNRRSNFSKRLTLPSVDSVALFGYSLGSDRGRSVSLHHATCNGRDGERSLAEPSSGASHLRMLTPLVDPVITQVYRNLLGLPLNPISPFTFTFYLHTGISCTLCNFNKFEYTYLSSLCPNLFAFKSYAKRRGLSTLRQIYVGTHTPNLVHGYETPFYESVYFAKCPSALAFISFE